MFLTELYARAETCNFQEKERMIRDKIVFSTQGKLQELLLRESDLDLKKAINICRAFEATKQSTKEMNNNENSSVNKLNSAAAFPRKFPMKTRAPHQSKGASNSNQKGSAKIINDCRFCGKTHDAVKTKCFAWNKICNNCKGRNHFQAKCKKIQMLEMETDSDNSDSSWLATVNVNDKERLTALMHVNDCAVRFQLDTGADVNTINKKFVRKDQVKATTQKLVMWNKSNLKPLGETSLTIENPKTGKKNDVKFIVVHNDYTCLLGLKTIQDMNLFTVNNANFIANLSTDKAQFGDLGEVTLSVNPNIPPRALPSRNLPLALQSDVKQELNRLVETGVLVPVDEPTEWVSQMAVVKKPNGSLRICIDPQPLNEALRREHYKLPTLDDVLPSLHNTKVFSKLDVKQAYWHVKLDKESSLLTTMITPFGRYRWSRLPFGLNVSSEIFQRKLTEALSGLQGVICVADDIIVTGSGLSETEANEDHDRNMKALQLRCKNRNIKLNDEKAALKRTEIKFMGHLITSKGVKVDQSKVTAILEMPAPTDVSGVKRFCGMVQYLAKFLPNLQADLEPIRQLTKKNVEWKWTTNCKDAFQMIKKKLTETPVLAYFDPNKELVLQVDSSKDGLGAALLQDDKPLEYASRSLTPAERNWAQIEKETLAVVFGLERFDQYTYGRKVIIHNDHKPLASILKKPLSKAPKRLQSLMLRLYRYDIEFNYIEGSKLLIADTLSRAYIDNNDFVKVMKVNALKGCDDERICQVREATANDESMQVLLRIIKDGWPKHKSQVPSEVRVYYDIRDTLSFQDGIILKGERIVIPASLRAQTKKQLHASHLGYDSMMRHARDTVYWPGMNREIQELANNCESCQELKPRNQKETLKQHDEYQSPWAKIGIDLFEIHGRNYLVTVDYYSNFIEVDHMTSTTSKQCITKLKAHFARYGIPLQIVSDSGSQFVSQEFKQFTHDWGINHITSSPLHHQSNGKAESAVKIIKNMMTKANQDGTDQYEALLELRNTPRQDTNLSPASMMFSIRPRTMIPFVNNKLRNKPKVTQRRNKRRATVKKYYDRTAKDLSQLKVGDLVYYIHSEGNKRDWRKGKITARYSDRSYLIEGDRGGVYRRNRKYIRVIDI